MAKLKKSQGRTQGRQHQQPRQQSQRGPRGPRGGKRAYGRSRPWWSTPWAMAAAVVVVLVVVAGFLVWGNVFQQAPNKPQNDAQIIQQATHVSSSVYDGVTPQTLSLRKIPGSPALRKAPDGKVQFLYIGGEFCPYCAAERWSIVAALSRFGTFQGLQLTTSAGPPEAFPNTPTFSFRNVKYTSDYLSLSAVELVDRDHQPVATPAPDDNALMAQLDPGGNIPFLVVGGQYQGAVGFQNDVLSGQSWTDIANNLSNPSAGSTKGIIGEANMLTAAICATNGGQPANVCQSVAVKKAAQKLQ
jgi:hypothetical protein